jgi:hypothetical protein
MHQTQAKVSYVEAWRPDNGIIAIITNCSRRTLDGVIDGMLCIKSGSEYEDQPR